MRDFKRNDRFGDRGGFHKGGGFNKGGFGGNRGGGRDFGRPVEMHEAVCAQCGKTCEVPFRPNGEKPVFCKECFDSQKEGGFRNDAPRSFRTERNDRPMRSERPAQDFSKQFDMLGAKLDTIINLLSPQKETKTETEEKPVKKAKKAKKE